MAATLIVEEERGTYAGTRHLHNGYYAGDFTLREAVRTTAQAASSWALDENRADADMEPLAFR